METSPSERVRSGSRAAFDEIFDAHAGVVYAHALRVTGNWAVAEDVVSLTFLEAWRLREKLRAEVLSVRAWLLGITNNVLRNTTRAARRHRAAMSRVPPGPAVPDLAEEVVGRLADTEQLQAAARALGRLRRADREVFTLCVWSDLSYAEAAEVLGIPVGTVRSRLSRARTRLRELAHDELRGGRKPMERGGPKPMEPLAGSGHISGSRTPAARSPQERNR
ncbi:RNA polymerase sigma factor [Streptomyces sp. NPDC020747]|uniref:RNA polymerase sigma factor n=1 Tax=Streptomyces sp. NPDC020747 TaxID=3365086 RepID=UPI0037A483D2